VVGKSLRQIRTILWYCDEFTRHVCTQNEDNLPGNPYDQDRAANVAGAAAMGSGTSEVFGKPFTAEENAATSATTGTSSHAGSSEEFKVCNFRVASQPL
jgi:hypothetical protein